MIDTVRATIDRVLDGRLLLTHPFYRRWEQGALAHDELARYAEQYRFFESFLPEFLGEVASRLDDGPTRRCVLDNLADEIASPSHLELFERFAEAYGAENADVSPAMSSLVAAYRSAIDEGVAVAVAGLLAYEVQGAAIASSKARGLEVHYGAAPQALDFWLVHGRIEDDHAQWTLEGLDALAPSDADVERGVDLVASAWWAFLDEREVLATH